ncbi:MAG TPA: DUF5004 domain-containing protein [Bacteroidia bacterium]|jgi:hypothetical protein|nr:DUF5004 domain-containing protein [Bacteroidia bacterium]
MKKIISFFFVAAMVTLVACGGKKSDMIAGSWKLGDMSMPDAMPKDIPDSLKTKMMDQQKAMVEDLKKSATFDFNKDGSYSVKMMGKETKGKWKLSDDGMKLSMQDDGTEKDKEMTSDVVELTAAKLVFTMAQQGAKSTVTLVK